MLLKGAGDLGSNSYCIPTDGFINLMNVGFLRAGMDWMIYKALESSGFLIPT